MVSVHHLRKMLRRLHAYRDRDPIPSSLRGWSYDQPPVRPRAYMNLGVSEIAYGSKCGWRHLWLRHKAGVKPEATEAMSNGMWAHIAFHTAARDVRRLLARGYKPWLVLEKLLSRRPQWYRDSLPRWVLDLYRYLVVSWAGEAAGHTLYYGGVGVGFMPWLTEYRVDGSPLGLSKRLRVDAIGESGIVVEVKLGYPTWWHKIAVAGYALALESSLEAPIDYGLVIGVIINGGLRLEVEPVYIASYLREEFLRARDEAIDVLLSDYEPPQGSCGEVQ